MPHVRDAHRMLARPLGLVVATALVLTAGTIGAVPASAATYTDVVDMTFPTDPAVTFIDDFDAGRSGGRVHKANDMMGEQMMPVYAAVGGRGDLGTGSCRRGRAELRLHDHHRRR